MASFQVSGMSCGHCVRAVTEAVASVDPGATTHVDLPSGRVTVEGTAAEPERIAAAIEAEGYEVAR